jgi:hypothetical protein
MKHIPTLPRRLPTPVLNDWVSASGLGFGAMNATVEAMINAQTEQWQWLLTWQRSVAEWQQDLWDQWLSHWGGGVPIDA